MPGTRFALAASWLLLAPLVAPAQGTPIASVVPGDPAVPALTPAWFDLTLNDVPKGQVLVSLGRGDVWVAVEDVEQAGLVLSHGERLALGTRSLVSLRSLSPAVVYTLDEEQTVLRLTASQALLGRTGIDLNPRPRPERLSRTEAPTAFVNVGGRLDAWEDGMASAEAGIAMAGGVILSGASWSSTEGLLRGLTVAQWDNVPAMVRYSGGEFFAGAKDPLGGSALLLGVGAGREFSIDPYVIRDPYPRTSLFVSTPSTLEVWVGETLVRRTRVFPGTLDLENLPLNAGVNEVRTILRDAFGREESVASHFVMGTNLLAPGLVDWGVSAGLQRRDEQDGSIEYEGRPTVVGHWRAGLSRLLTMGAHAEANRTVVNAGSSAGLATSWGDVELGATASRAGENGAAGYVTWRARPSRHASFVTQLRVLSASFASTSLGADADRALLRGLFGAAVALRPGLSLSAELSGVRMREGGDGLRGDVRGAWTIARGRQVALSGSLAWQEGVGNSWGIFATYAIQLPYSHGLNLAARTGSAGETAVGTVSRGLGMGPGYGYRVEGSVGEAGHAAALDARAQSSFGWAAFTGSWANPTTAPSSHHEALEGATGLVLMNGGLHVTRPVEGSYALLVLDGAPGVRVTLDGQPVGRTRSDGTLFVPGLLPYFGNRLAIRDADLPLDFKVNEVERFVAPRYRGGSVEVFDVGPTRVLVGKLVLAVEEKTLIPEWGEIAIELPTGRVVSPIGTDGSFWLEGLTPGRHEALVRWAGRLCRMTFEVGQGTGVLDVGTRRCTQMLAAGGPPAP